MARHSVLVCIMVACFALMGGCGEDHKKPQPEKKDSKTVVIGLIPERNIFGQLERYEPLAAYLSEKGGVKVELKVLTRYGNIVDNFVSSGLDGAFFGSFSYTLAHTKLGVDVIARPVDVHGASTYYGNIFVRRDSGIRSAADMKGKVFAFVDKATTAGYLLPLAYFKESGIENHKEYFSETYFAGTHEAAIYDVLNGKADVGAAKNTVYAIMERKDPRIRKELILLVRSPDVPENGLAVRADLAPGLKSDLKHALLTMHEHPRGIAVLKRFGAQRFIETGDRDYANVYNMVEEIGIDLRTYNYINE